MRDVLKRFAGRFRVARRRPLILMYHRIAAPHVDPWGLAVHPDRFDSHLEVLQEHWMPLAMSELVRRLHRGTLPDNAIAVTFDDGYADNLRAARPRLEAAGVPATIFLVAGAIGQPREFWWDELARGILERHEALECEVPVDGQMCPLAFPAARQADVEMSANASWRAWQQPRTARQRAYRELWSRVREARAPERETAMQHFREVAELGRPDAADLPLTADEVVQIARDGVFEIGGHTLTHPVLTRLDPAERRYEILEGKRRCEELTARPVTGFAYPHGELDDDCRAAVREGDFEWACTTVAGPVGRACDRHALPRLFVQDWDADAFEAALR